MKRSITILILSLCCLQAVYAQNAEREFAFNNYRRYYSEARQCTDQEKLEAVKGLRNWFKENPQNMKMDKDLQATALLHLGKLLDNGTFTSMNAKERYLKKNKIFKKRYRNTPDDQVGIFIGDAFKRIFQITSAFRLGLIEGPVPDKVYKAILHYGELEITRSNNLPRFHASCFAIPTGAVNVYFSLLEEMDRAERGGADSLATEACDMLKTVGLQAWTQPLRRDETDQNVVSLERFRKHVWWVGGNALAYRQLLPVAAMYSSVPMIDLLSQICRKCISTTSQVTYDESFWTEGFTEDGAGWGHGKQCLIWGYPIHGTSAALKMLGCLKGTPWAENLNEENTSALMNFFRGGAWYWYKGWRLIGLDRNSYIWNPEEQAVPYRDMLDMVITDWLPSFTAAEQEELLQLQEEAHAGQIDMDGTKPGLYHGLRWFFNNDDLISKTPDHEIMVNMASYRCDGLEEAEFADLYNFYCNDGATLLQRKGNEYFQIMGGWDVTAYPGTTSREGKDRLQVVTNWSGYCSKHNFAAAAHNKNNQGLAGFIFEKTDARNKYPSASTIQPGENAVLYGVKAHKSWFFIDDFMVALGAGITNKHPEEPGMIRTTLDQTALEGEVRITRGKESLCLNKGRYDIREMAEKLGSPSTKDRKPVWISQKGKFSYALLPEYTNNGFVSLETCPTDWVKMNRGNKNVKTEMPDSVNILRIWTEHGQNPVDETYGYTVWTGEGKLPTKLPFKVERNDTLIQAVSACRGKLIQAVFYPQNPEKTGTSGMPEVTGKPEGVQTDILKVSKTGITVSAPCVLMLDRTGKTPMLYVTDATMNPELDHIEVRINGRSWKVPMPQGKRCGDCASLPLR